MLKYAGILLINILDINPDSKPKGYTLGIPVGFTSIIALKKHLDEDHTWGVACHSHGTDEGTLYEKDGMKLRPNQSKGENYDINQYREKQTTCSS